MITFEPFPKIPRLSRECIITEKIDGTNASIWILDAQGEVPAEALIVSYGIYEFAVVAASRKRFLTPKGAGDNFGFARWVHAHAEALVLELGYGTHFGEWWGSGIQRGYGLEKRFSLFNTSQWAEDEQLKHCYVVPVLYEGLFETEAIHKTLYDLKDTGSLASPGFMAPEGIVIYHTAARQLFKMTIDGDESWKGLRL